MSQDINLFAIGSIVNVPGIPEFQGITINNISDTGVTVTGPKCGNKVVISGRTPASQAPALDPEKVLEFALAAGDGPEVIGKPRAERGTYTEKMKHLKMPEAPTFTVSEFAEFNEIPVNYALVWVKENCEEAGVAQKTEGQRGRAAKLYKL